MTVLPRAMSTRARDAVMVSFFFNGFGFATWVSRIPEVRHELGLTNGQLGLLLLAISTGSVLSLPSTGALVNRWGASTVVRAGVLADVGGLVLAGVAPAWGSVTLTAVGLFACGLGVGVWDVAMNVEGAAVEHELGRTIMPRFHAGFSLGTVVGAGLGAATTAAGVLMAWHLGTVAAAMLLLGWWSAGRFLPAEVHDHSEARQGRSAWRAWREPRTLLIGVMVLALALTEGSANDWLAVGLIDGYDVSRSVGVLGFGAFVTAMTAGRIVGPVLLDRYGRVPVLLGTMLAASLGVLLVVFGAHPVLVVAGILLWGLGASLGFPVGMSAAADDPVHAAARVSVVSSMAYTAFLVGPPFLGFLADHVGTLHALLVISVLLLPSALVVPAARERRAS